MKIAILADIHANAKALERVIEDCRNEGIHAYWLLGDYFGRGPDVIEVLQRLREITQGNKRVSWVLGNHDAMANNMLSEKEYGQMNHEPRRIIERHKQEVEKDQNLSSFIQQQFTHDRLLPQKHFIKGVCHILVHGGSVDHPGYFRYIYPWSFNFFWRSEFERLSEILTNHTQEGWLKLMLRKLNLAKKQTVVQWYGHTHVPALIRAENAESIEVIRVVPGNFYQISPGNYWIINPGSVGWPRDLDNRAAYAVFDTKNNTVIFKRLEYEWRETARKMIQLGYPENLVRALRDAPLDDTAPDNWRQYYESIRSKKNV